MGAFQRAGSVKFGEISNLGKDLEEFLGVVEELEILL